MKTQHTPGPWKADLSPGSFRTVTGADGERVAKADLVLTKANSNKWQPDTEKTEANARLIAAAPELLESEMKFVQLCNNLAVALTDEQIAEARAALISHCHDSRATIAKALGN